MMQSIALGRRRFLGLIGSAVAASALAACSSSAGTPSSTPAPTSAAAVPTPTSTSPTSTPRPTTVARPAATAAPTSAGKVSVTLWHANSGVLGTELAKMGKDFNTSQHQVELTLVFSGDYNALNQKLLAAIQAGTPPDIAQAGNNSFIASYLAAGAVAPIADFVNGPDGLSKDDLADIYPGFIEDNTFDDKGRPTLVSWPFNKSDEVMYYNRDLLNGLGVSAPPATWDEFVADAKKVTASGKTKGLAWTPSSDLFTAMLYAYGGKPYDPTTKQVAFQSDAGVKALSILTGMVKGQTAYLTKSYDWQGDFEHGKSVFALSTIVSRAYIEKDLQGQSGGFYLGIAPLPRGDQPATVLFGSNGVILAKVPDAAKQGAWAFLKWYTAPEQTARWSLASGYMPIRKSALDTAILKKAIAADPRREVAIKSLDFVHPWQPNLAAWTAVDRALSDAITAALIGKATPADALNQAARKGNSALESG